MFVVIYIHIRISWGKCGEVLVVACMCEHACVHPCVCVSMFVCIAFVTLIKTCLPVCRQVVLYV